MAKDASAALLDEMERDGAAPPPADKIERIKAAVRRLRDLTARKEDATAMIREISREVDQIERTELVNLFDEAGIDHVSLPPEGNYPGYQAKAQPYYYANIKVDWPEAQREAAFRWLVDRQCGDLIKTVVVVELGLGEAAKTKQVIEALRKIGVAHDVRKSVPWNTLTAFVKEQSDKLDEADRATLGATVGRIVRVTRARGG